MAEISSRVIPEAVLGFGNTESGKIPAKRVIYQNRYGIAEQRRMRTDDNYHIRLSLIYTASQLFHGFLRGLDSTDIAFPYLRNEKGRMRARTHNTTPARFTETTPRLSLRKALFSVVG